MTVFNKDSARIISMAKAAHLKALPPVPERETSIMIPVSAYIVRLLHIKNKPLSENFILKSIRDDRVHMVTATIHPHMLNMVATGIAAFVGSTGLFELSFDMKELIKNNSPKEPPKAIISEVALVSTVPDEVALTDLLASTKERMVKAEEEGGRVLQELADKYNLTGHTVSEVHVQLAEASRAKTGFFNKGAFPSSDNVPLKSIEQQIKEGVVYDTEGTLLKGPVSK